MHALVASAASGAMLWVAVTCHATEVKVEQDAAGEWVLVSEGRPYFVRGMNYRVTKVGQSPDQGTLKDWAGYDGNSNGKSDGPFDAWVDANWNNRQDADEPAVGDFELMRRMGVNTIRWYHNDFKQPAPAKRLLRELHQRYRIRVAVGDKFGAYAIGSGAAWSDGTDYRDPAQQQRMMESIRRMVEEHRHEPYTLLWVLGNENNYPWTNTNAGQYPEDYARFVNRAAQMIHAMDRHHPVAVVNGDTQFLEVYRRLCPDVDIFGVNAYRGPDGFGDLWDEVKRVYGKPVLITEYGGSFAPGTDEAAQARYHQGCWLDIWANRAGGRGSGNAIGGFAYEWLDEWWKAGDPWHQAVPGTTGHQGTGTAKWDQEYGGIASQGDGSLSPFLRRLRKVYAMYQDVWLQCQENAPHGR